MKEYRNKEFYKKKFVESDSIDRIVETLAKNETVVIAPSRSGIKLCSVKSRYISIWFDGKEGKNGEKE